MLGDLAQAEPPPVDLVDPVVLAHPGDQGDLVDPVDLLDPVDVDRFRNRFKNQNRSRPMQTDPPTSKTNFGSSQGGQILKGEATLRTTIPLLMILNDQVNLEDPVDLEDPMDQVDLGNPVDASRFGEI